MSDDWRVELEVDARGGMKHLLDAAHEHAVASDMRRRMGERVVVTESGDRIYAYAGTEAEADAAADVLRELAAAHELSATATIMRWHPEAERWEPPAVPLPSTPQEHEAEHEVVREREAAESRRSQFALWEVRVELPDRHEAVALAARLEKAGFRPVRRSHYVIAGTQTEDDAAALADRLRGEVPPGSTVTTQGGEAEPWAELHPFAVLGGLAG